MDQNLKGVKPGLLVKKHCIERWGLSVTEAARALKVTRVNLSRLLNGKISISPEMAVRIGQVFNTSPKKWLKLQLEYDLEKVKKKKIKLRRLSKKKIKVSEKG